jgi:hypothetical protein
MPYDAFGHLKGAVMGLFRKITSVSTMGAVHYRTPEERTAHYTKQIRNEIRDQGRDPNEETPVQALASSIGDVVAKRRAAKDEQARLRAELGNIQFPKRDA